MNDVESELLHERNGTGFGFADFVAQGDAGGARGLHHFFLHGRRDLVPNVFGDDGCADQLRELDVEHVLRAAEPLVAQSHQRRGLESVDEAGLQAGEDVGGGERNGKKTVDLVELEGGGVALQDAELHAANVVGTRGGLLGEEVNPAGVAPIQDDEAALGEAFFETIGDVVANVIQLFIGGEHHGDLQARRRRDRCRSSPRLRARRLAVS